MPKLIAILHKSRELFTYLVGVYFLFPVVWASYLIAAWGLVTLVTAVAEFVKIRKKDIWNILLYTSPFFVLLASVFFHGGGGEKNIEKGLSFIVFPVCIFLSTYKINKRELKKITWVFLAGCVVLALKGLLMYILTEPMAQYTVQHDLIFKYRSEFNLKTHIAPTYASIYFGFALLLVLIQFREMKKQRVLLLILSGFVFLNLLLLSAKMPIVAFILISIVLVLRKQIFVGWLSFKKRIWILALMLTGFVFLFLFTRWNEVFTGLTHKNNDASENSVGIRAGIFTCAFELSKEHYLLGVGPQHLQKKLDECYYQFEGDDFERHQFNTHNQYFDVLLSSGLIGIVVLLLTLIVPLVQSFRQNDPILFSFVLLIGICMLTENILNRQAGVVFYVFFNALLVNRSLEKGVA